jgi:hypothetical protein
MDVERLLAEEDAGWRELLAVFESMPPERFDESGVTPEGWSPKDVMFHIGAWLSECTAVLEAIGSGGEATEGHGDDAVTTDSKNAAWFNMSRELDVQTVRRDFESARAIARQRFSQMTDPTPEGWSWFDESGPIHYAEHGKDLREWLERPVG